MTEMEFQHNRVWSQSTSASCSPQSSSSSGIGIITSHDIDKNRHLIPRCNEKKVISPRLHLLQQCKASVLSPSRCRKKRSDMLTLSRNPMPMKNTRVYKNPQDYNSKRQHMLNSKTPALGVRKTVSTNRAELFKSPGGSDYIVTPGRHKISLTEFLASFDKQATEDNQPALRGVANYAQGMYKEWLAREKQIDSEVFMLSFCDESPMEQFRQMAVQSVFNYAVEHKLHEKTIHLTVMNISRLIHARVIQSKEKLLTHELFACTVMAALRNAIKNDESYEKSDKFRLEPEHVWKSSQFLASVCSDKSAKRLNEVESECLKILEEPSNPPLAPEFFERYLEVGAWPTCQDQYKELGSFLMGLGLFSCGSKNPLRRVPSSQLAAAALVLAVKVVNTDNNSVKYEFWPSRLEAYTGYSLELLKPAIRGLAHLLRNKPDCSTVLEKYYSKWSEFDWN